MKMKPVITITADQARAARNPELKDMLDVNGLSDGDVNQLIEQNMEYTDTLVLKGLMESDLIEALVGQGFVVNTMSGRKNYTTITWPR